MSEPRRARVVVVGSLHLDVMVRAPVRPRRGETLIGDAWWPKCGGKGGNQACEAALAGATVAMIGAVGDDDFGRRLLANLDRCGVDRRAVATVAGGASGMSVAIVDGEGDYAAVVVSGVNAAVAPPAVNPASFAGVDVVVLQNEIAPAANLAAARAGRAAGAVVVLNAAPARDLDPALAERLDLLVVNAIEAEMLGAGPVGSLAAAERAARLLAARVPAAVVTAGGSGVAFADAAGSGALAAETVTVAGTHGAGDCFVGVLAARLGAGADLRAAITAANAAAGRLVAMTEAERAARASVPDTAAGHAAAAGD